jgi:hypothetical protein
MLKVRKCTVFKMMLFFEQQTIRYYVTIRSCLVNLRKFNWRNLPKSTSMSLSLSVSVSMDTDTDRDMDVDVDTDTDRDMDVDVDMGRWTRTQTGTWTWTWADPDVFRHFFHSTFFPPVGLFFPNRRFVPFGVFSIQRFFHSAFLTIQPFVPFDVFSIRRFFHSTFCPIRPFFHLTFCPIRRSFDFLSFDVFYFRHLILRHFVGEPKIPLSEWELFSV